MNRFSQQLWAVVMVLSLGLMSTTAIAADDDDRRGPTVLDTLVKTDGAQAVVAAVLVVDDAGVLDFSLAQLLDNRRAKIVLLAPSNAAFEKLLGLDDGFLDGLSIGDVAAALPGAIGAIGVDAEDVAAILLQHAALLPRANLRTASETALLRKGQLTVADGDVLTVGIGGTGVEINRETTIIKPDVRAKNGVIHFIDTVIVNDALSP